MHVTDRVLPELQAKGGDACGQITLDYNIRTSNQHHSTRGTHFRCDVFMQRQICHRTPSPVGSLRPLQDRARTSKPRGMWPLLNIH